MAWGHGLRHTVPFDHWMRLSGRMTPSIRGAVTVGAAIEICDDGHLLRQVSFAPTFPKIGIALTDVD
jgi:hypothetical protein